MLNPFGKSPVTVPPTHSAEDKFVEERNRDINLLNKIFTGNLGVGLELGFGVLL